MEPVVEPELEDWARTKGRRARMRAERDGMMKIVKKMAR
jgi:hypothetical protein